MKHITHLFTLIFLFTSPMLFAQQQTLFDGEFRSSGFGGPQAKFTSVNDGQLGVLFGGYGGWLINGTVMIGGGGYGLVTLNDVSKQTAEFYGVTDRPVYLEMGYGGGMIEVVLSPSRLVHVYTNLLIGAGGANYKCNASKTYTHDDWWEDHDGNRMLRDTPDFFFVLEPSVNVEVNMTSWFRLGVGASYRHITGINRLYNLSNSDLSGASGNITFKFGEF